MKYYSDGFTLGSNPSEDGGGFTVVDESNRVLTTETVRQPRFTNNEAELLGVLYTARIAKNNDAISTDSMNTIFWIQSGKSKSRPDLNDAIQEAMKLISKKNINLMWEGREFNLAGIYNEAAGIDTCVPAATLFSTT